MLARISLLIVLTQSILFAAEPPALWTAIQQPVFDGGQSFAASNVTLKRDRIQIVLAEGTIQFAKPVEGLVFAAAFGGHGRIQIAPPDALESQQLKLHTCQASLDLEFTEATFVFSDNTLEEVAAAAKAGGAAFRGADLYLNRQKNREDSGTELVPRLFKAVMSGDRKRAPFFAADLKTRDRGWIHVRHDLLDTEEITVGRWVSLSGYNFIDTWMSFPAGNRTSAAAYDDPRAKLEFLVRGYTVDVDVTNGTELRAVAKVKIDQRTAGERVLLFDFDSNLRMEYVKASSGATLPFFQPKDPKNRNQSYGDYVAVVLPEATVAGETQMLEFKYAGKRVIEKVGNGNFFCQSSGWYPSYGKEFALRTDFELNFRSPKRYKLVATGNRINETVDGDLAISTWKSDIPLAVAGFAFGDYRFHTDKAGEVVIEVFANKEPDDFMKQFTDSGAPVGSLSPAALVKTMGAEVANTVRLFEQFFGPYPYKRLAVTNIPWSYGQGWPMLLYLSSISFMDSTQRQALGISKHREITDFFRAHESSHQWWGHRVGWKSYRDQWMSEGFAQFSGNLYVQFRENWKAYITRIRQDREELFTKDEKNRVFESLGPLVMGHRLSTADSPGAYSNVVYNKGGLVLHMLRMMMFNPGAKNPDEAFMVMMRDFCQTYHNKPASTDDFKRIAEKHMMRHMDQEGNGKLDWFFRQYVYGTGMARYELKYTVTPAGDNKWELAGSIVQSGVPEGWVDALPVYAEVNGKQGRIGWLGAGGKEKPFKVVVGFKPEKMMLNMNEDILADIKK